MVTSYLRQERDPMFCVMGDPVRVGLGMLWRISEGREVFSLVYNDEIMAVICVAFVSVVPTELVDVEGTYENPTIAVPYTVWSLKRGFGRSIVFDTIGHIKATRPEIVRVVTLSPKTETAFRFHTGNGARQISRNAESDNYEYTL